MDLRKLCAVALHPEGVDRNREISVAAVAACIVALHPEGVDRNDTASKKLWTYPVALHPEGVDRNRIRGGPLAPAGSRPPPGGRG